MSIKLNKYLLLPLFIISGFIFASDTNPFCATTGVHKIGMTLILITFIISLAYFIMGHIDTAIKIIFTNLFLAIVTYLPISLFNLGDNCNIESQSSGKIIDSTPYDWTWLFAILNYSGTIILFFVIAIFITSFTYRFFISLFGINKRQELFKNAILTNKQSELLFKLNEITSGNTSYNKLDSLKVSYLQEFINITQRLRAEKLDENSLLIEIKRYKKCYQNWKKENC